MSKQFIPVPNFMFEKDKNDVYFMKKLGTRGFVLYCYLLMKQGWYDELPIQVSQLHKDINIEGVKRVSKFKQLLCNLKRLNLITCESLNEKTRSNELLYIKVFKIDEGYEKINSQFVEDYINKISHIAFTTYCLLKKYHNSSLGNQMAGNVGYAEISEEFIATILGYKDRRTIGDHIKQLHKLIKIERQEPLIVTNEFGQEEAQYLPNRYKVKAKYDITNKYYLPPLKQEK